MTTTPGAIGQVFTWLINGEAYNMVIEAPCPICDVVAIVALPLPLRRMQPDDTTHVCHPSFGGCNHGFAREG